MNMQKKIEKILSDSGIDEYKKEAQLIIESISGLSREDLILGKPVSNPDEIIRIASLRAQTKKPIQHLLGFQWFMGEKYKVNEFVLIPRDETEILVESAYNKIKNLKNKIDILDIGLGSGCISCALAKKLINYDIEILGVDISSNALQAALENIIQLDLVKKVIIRKSDLFSKVRDFEKFDLIISNPPYIPQKEKNNLQQEVLFDPDIALFAPDEKGIDFYKKIIEKAPKFLKPKGLLAFELGINQSELVYELMEQDFSNIEIIKDLAGIDRVILGSLN